MEAGDNGVPTALSVGQVGMEPVLGNRRKTEPPLMAGWETGIVGWQVQPLCASREVDAAGLCLSACSGDSYFSFIALYRSVRRCCCSSWLAQLYHPSQNLVKKGCRKYENHVEPLHGKHLL